MAEISFFNIVKEIKAQKTEFPVVFLYGYHEFLGEKIIDAFCTHFLEKKTILISDVSTSIRKTMPSGKR